MHNTLLFLTLQSVQQYLGNAKYKPNFLHYNAKYRT